MQIAFGPLAPDQGAGTAGIVTIANNVLPKVNGYGPAPSMIVQGTEALPSAPRGSITCIKRDGTTQVFILTVDALYSVDAVFDFVLVEDGFSCTPGDDWSCEQFGNYLLFTNTTDGLWAYNIETAAPPTYIADAGDPRELFVTANMVFGLDCKDGVGARDNRLIRNSDFNDHTDWKTGAADYQPLESGAELIAGVRMRGGAGVVFQREAMRLIQFGNAGGGALYSLQEIADGRGSVGAKSVIGFDGVVYFLATNGFWQYSGNGLEHIGDGFIDKWFLAQVPTLELKDIQAAIDPSRKIVLWLYPATGLVLGYAWGNTGANKWFTWSTGAITLSRLATSGYTWDAAGATWATWDDIPAIPFDDRFWQGGQQFLAALNADYMYASFSGESAPATIRTALGNSPVTALIGWVTPYDDCPVSMTSLGVSDALSGAVIWKSPMGKVSAGRVPLRGRGMNIAFEWTTPAAAVWTYAHGFDHIKASSGGVK